MTKLHIVGQDQEDKIGGGWSWVSNMKKCFELTTPEDCDVYVITSVSMLNKLSEIPLDKKIVLRVDNVLKKSCNSDIYPFNGDKVSRMEALKMVADKADMVVFQSQWAESYLNPYLQVPNEKRVIINNATDESIFNDKGRAPRKSPEEGRTFMYSRSSNHDNKQWHQAWYAWQIQQIIEPKSKLLIAGRFSNENIPNNFDFFNGEQYEYLGFITDPKVMAEYLRNTDAFYYTYHMDACSNTLIEALMCGCKIFFIDRSGGAMEIAVKFNQFGPDYFKLKRMKNEYQKVFKKLMKG